MSSPPPEPEQDLDDALEAIFDAPTLPNTSAPAVQPEQPSTPPPPTPPTCIPQTPETSPKKPRQKSILEHLAENKERLSLAAGAARVAEDLRKLSEARADTDPGSKHVPSPSDNDSKRVSIAEVMAERRKPKRRKTTKDAFAVIGHENRLDGSAHETATYDYIDRKVTNMSLIEARYEKARLEAVFEHTTRLDIADITSRYEEVHMGALKNFSVYACLVKKLSKKQAKNGKMYAVWSLCNMPRGTYNGKDVRAVVVRLLLFDDAYETFHTRCEGTVFALSRPALSRRQEGTNGKFSHVLRISKKENVTVLGVCKDFKLCEATKYDGQSCGQWYHAHHMRSCTKHERKKLAGLTTGTRMDIQNAVRPNVKDPLKGIRAPLDISAIGGEPENRDIGEVDRKQQHDSQRARDIKKRVSEQRLGRTKKAGKVVANVQQGGVKKKIVKHDPMATVARETRPVRNRPGERHARLLGRSDKQSRYHEACEILYGLGFKLRDDGGWDPPATCAVTLATTRTHMFSGLGKLKRRRGGELGHAKEEETKKSDSCDGKEESGLQGEHGEMGQAEVGKMENAGGKTDEEAKQDSPDTPSPTSNEAMKLEGEGMKEETGDAEAGNETKNDTVGPQDSTEETKTTTPEETASTKCEEMVLSDEIVLSDESDDS